MRMQHKLLVLSLTLSFIACSAASKAGLNASSAGSSTGAGAENGASAVSSPGETGPSEPRAAGRLFRGTLDERGIELRLERNGENLSGAYTYDGNAQSLSLKGRIDSQGNLSLQEFAPGGKQTGQFKGKLNETSELDPSSATIEANWTQPNGSHEAFVYLTEQHVEFTRDLRIVPKSIRERHPDINASYPQIVGGNDPNLARFNQRAQAIVTKAVREFKEGEPAPDRSSYSASYNILLATDDLISVEIAEDSYSGGAHPDSEYYTLNYDLRTGRELELKDLFKPGADYKKSIREYALKDMNARARAEAEREKMPADQRNEEMFDADQLSEWTAFAVTRKGIFVYYDLPHVIAVFSREFIPATILKDQLDPQRGIIK